MIAYGVLMSLFADSTCPGAFAGVVPPDLNATTL